MNNSGFLPGQCIRWMRCARPAIDCGLLFLGLFLFMHFDNISAKNQMEKTSSQRIAHAPQATSTQKENHQKPVSIVQQFSNEADMWNAFSTWLQTTETAPGNCRIEAPTDMDQTPYSLQCAGSSNTKNNKPEKTVNPNAPFASNVLVAPEKISRHANDENKTAPVSGWINTPTGRKHFDPVSKRWLP